jgi:hypothetical protein
LGRLRREIGGSAFEITNEEYGIMNEEFWITGGRVAKIHGSGSRLRLRTPKYSLAGSQPASLHS